MNATSCLEIFSRLIFNAATLGIILKNTHTFVVFTDACVCVHVSGRSLAVVPDASELGAVVVAIRDVVQNLQHQLPQLAVLHQRQREERVQEGRRQRRRHGLGPKPGGHLRSEVRGQSKQS